MSSNLSSKTFPLNLTGDILSRLLLPIALSLKVVFSLFCTFRDSRFKYLLTVMAFIAALLVDACGLLFQSMSHDSTLIRLRGRLFSTGSCCCMTCVTCCFCTILRCLYHGWLKLCAHTADTVEGNLNSHGHNFMPFTQLFTSFMQLGPLWVCEFVLDLKSELSLFSVKLCQLLHIKLLRLQPQ